MARPRKQGIEYFSLDVVLDDKFDVIEAQHGIVGFGVLIKMYQRIYSEGYCYEWTEMEQLLFSNKIKVDKDIVMDIINDAIKWGIFDSDIYNKYKVLTSRGIQTRYVAVTYKRAAVEMEKGHLLIDVSDRSNIKLIEVSDIQNQDTSTDTDIPSTQSKVKESKVKESKEINVPADADDVPPAQEFRYLEDSTEYKAAVYLREQILAFNPKCKVPGHAVKDLQVWADTIRLTFERDGRTKDDMRKVIKYIFHDQQGEFWRPNVQSPASLRRNWDTIYGQMLQADKSKQTKQPSVKPTTFNSGAQDREWNFEELAALEDERMKRNLEDVDGLDNEELKRRLRVVDGGIA